MLRKNWSVSYKSPSVMKVHQPRLARTLSIDKRKRHTPDQMFKKLPDADAMLGEDKSVGEVLQLLDVSESTLIRWRSPHEVLLQWSQAYVRNPYWWDRRKQLHCRRPPSFTGRALSEEGTAAKFSAGSIAAQPRSPYVPRCDRR